MKRLITAVAVFAVLLTSSIAFAGEWTHPCGFKFWLPEEWETVEVEGVFVATDPGDEVEITFILIEDCADLDAAYKLVKKELEEEITDLEVEEATKAKVNGIDMWWFEGDGKVEGHEVELGMAIYDAGDSVLLVYGGVLKDGWKDHDDEIWKILKSVKKK